jgi:anti-sigma regulatory factor (Ser/Thr protein kinase)
MSGKQDFGLEHEIDLFLARRGAVEAARGMRFSQRAIAEVAVVASELCTNVLKHGAGGRLSVERVEDPDLGVGVRLIAFDRGAAFRDFDGALRDGFDDEGPIDTARLLGRGGIGAGLGAIARFSNAMGWRPVEGGKEVWAVRYARHLPS